MTHETPTLARRAVAVAATLALGAASLLVATPAANAAPGDITNFAVGTRPIGLASDASGNLWSANIGSQTISRLTLAGAVTNFALTRQNPQLIVAGSDNAMWFTYERDAAIGRISPDGVVTDFSNGVPGPGFDIALGPDNALWITVPTQKQVIRMTTAGAVTAYDTGNAAAQFITPGPSGSNRMYMTLPQVNKIGVITMQGQFSTIDGPDGATAMSDIITVGNNVWFGSATNNTLRLTRIVNDSSFIQVLAPQIPTPGFFGLGRDNTMWITDGTQSTVNHFTNAGAFVAGYSTGAVPGFPVQALDGNVWVTIPGGNAVARILTGVVPTVENSPALTPTTNLVAGTPITVSNGTWDNVPTSYNYQWQVCQTAEATTCADKAGATGSTYTVATEDVGKYLRAGVAAVNLNGAGTTAYTAIVATGAAPAPPAPSPTPPAPATGDTATIGNGASMTLDAPSRQKRGKGAWYEVVFTASDAQGTVVFEFTKGSRSVTKTATISSGVAEYRWKAPKKWRKGATSVSATYVPAAGSPYTAAEVKDTVRIR